MRSLASSSDIGERSDISAARELDVYKRQVIGRDGIPFEVQIRTKEMHHIAEYGIAAQMCIRERSYRVRTALR